MFWVEWSTISDQEKLISSRQKFGGFAKALKLFLMKLESPRVVQVKITADKRQDLELRLEKVKSAG